MGRALSAISISTQNVLYLWALYTGETISYTGCWFQAHTAFWRVWPQCSGLLPLSWHWTCVFKRPATILSSQLLQYSEEVENQWNTWAWWVLSAVLLLWSKFFGWKQCCVQYHDDVNPWIIVLTETLHAGVTNCYPESVSGPIRAQCHHFHTGSGLMCQVIGRSSGEMGSYRNLVLVSAASRSNTW